MTDEEDLNYDHSHTEDIYTPKGTMEVDLVVGEVEIESDPVKGSRCITTWHNGRKEYSEWTHICVVADDMCIKCGKKFQNDRVGVMSFLRRLTHSDKPV